MTLRFLTLVALLTVPAAAATMPVSTFLAKADALKRNGPLAIFSSDLKVLTRQVKSDAASLAAENKAAEATGRRRAYCTPAGGVKMDEHDVVAAMEAVPPANRSRTDSKDALRDYLAKRHPCPAG